MSEVNFIENWSDVATQCSQCKSFQVKGEKSACVPEDKTFIEALAEYGECSPTAHCDYFEAK